TYERTLDVAPLADGLQDEREPVIKSKSGSELVGLFSQNHLNKPAYHFSSTAANSKGDGGDGHSEQPATVSSSSTLNGRLNIKSMEDSHLTLVLGSFLTKRFHSIKLPADAVLEWNGQDGDSPHLAI
ncbi:hypothetical protein DFQ27_008101, partial [Actinomortierella ambigua]